MAARVPLEHFIAIVRKTHPPDRPELPEAEVTALAEDLRRMAESFPPFTPEQRDRLAILLRPARAN